MVIIGKRAGLFVDTRHDNFASNRAIRFHAFMYYCNSYYQEKGRSFSCLFCITTLYNVFDRKRDVCFTSLYLVLY